MEIEMKLVDYASYCNNCEYGKLKHFQEPCNECLETPAREGSDEPIKFKDKNADRVKKIPDHQKYFNVIDLN